MVPVQVRQEHRIYILGIQPSVLQVHEQLSAGPRRLRADPGVYQDRTSRRPQYVRPDASPEGVAVGESPGVSVNVRFPLIPRHTGEDPIQPEKSPLYVSQGGDLDPPNLDALQDQCLLS